MTVGSPPLFALMGRHLVSFPFFTTRHKALLLNDYYFTCTLLFTPSTKTFAGLNAGML